jgi:tol-pal system protein YbgF
MGLKISTSKLLYALVLLSTAGSLSACSHTPSFNPQANSDVSPVPSPEPKTDAQINKEQISKLQDRIQDLETRLSALNDKINLENGVQGAVGSADKKIPIEVVQAPPAHAKVIPAKTVTKKTTAKKSTDNAFVSNESVDRFREAKILYDSKKYADAVLEFSEFVKSEPDHTLAPAAQYYLGMSYLNQNEYKLAEEEFSRGLLSYPHSSYIPDTLLALSQVSEKLNKPTKVSYFKEKLLSNFPNSPQAKSQDLKPLNMPPEGATEEKPAPEMSQGEATVIEKPKPPTAPSVKTEAPESNGAAE